MSILNQASDGLPGLFVLLFRFVHYSGGCAPRSELLAACYPAIPASFSTKEGLEKLKQTLATWIDVGFFTCDEEEESQTIALSPAVREYLGRVKAVEDATSLLPAAARSVLFRPENRERLWAAKQNKAGDFCRLLGWLCVQDVWSTAIENIEHAKRLEEEQLDSRDEMEFVRNKDRWPGFKAWAKYLQLAHETKAGIRIDLTRAVKSLLSRVFPGAPASIPIDEFIAALASKLPFIDGGEVWTEVSSKLRPESWRAPGMNEISTVSSMFLLRLEHDRVLVTDDRADTHKRALLGAGNRPLGRSVSHIKMIGAA